jgi:hypothetical protein
MFSGYSVKIHFAFRIASAFKICLLFRTAVLQVGQPHSQGVSAVPDTATVVQKEGLLPQMQLQLVLAEFISRD